MSKDNVFSNIPENSIKLFSLIQKLGPISKGELCNILNKKMTPINRMLAPLEKCKLVVEHGIGNSTGGRKPILYDVNKSMYYVGAVNISTTYCEVGIMNFKIEMLRSYRFKILKDDAPSKVIEKILEVFNEHIEFLKIDRNCIYGIGLSIFSSFNKETGKINRPIVMHVNEKWLNIPVAKIIEEKSGFKVVMEKGTNAAALLEYLYGKGKGTKRMLYILCAMSIRSAVISSGEIINTAPNYEDAFGHMTINIDGERCECGNYGCVGTYTTIPAIINNISCEIKKGRVTSINKLPDEIDFLDVCIAAEKGDPLSCEVIKGAASVLGSALANYINLFCPDVVILGGLLVRASNLYYNVAVETAKRKTSLLLKDTNIIYEKNGLFNSPITAGAGSMMIENILSSNINSDVWNIDKSILQE